MNELRRMAYLEAMGIDGYISRTPLPGAAPTRRLAIVRSAAPAVQGSEAVPSTAPDSSVGVAGVGAAGQGLAGQGLAGQAAASDIAAMLPGTSPAKRKEEVPERPAPAPRRGAVDVPRFSLAAIVAGPWLWLEDLAHGALGRDQVWLVRAMAHALQVQHRLELPAPEPQVAQFDWPIHKNQQLDSGADAARAAVAGFVGRRLQQFQCGGVIVLGAAAADWMPDAGLTVPAVTTHSTVDMLSEPATKREVWQQLLSLPLAGDNS